MIWRSFSAKVINTDFGFTGLGVQVSSPSCEILDEFLEFA